MRFVVNYLVRTGAMFAALLGCGVVFSLLAQAAGRGGAGMRIEKPEGAAELLVLLASVLCTACMEEGWFRFYLAEKLRSLGWSFAAAAAVQAAAFALLHVLEGPWGIANALASALVLSFAYFKSGSFGAITLSHALYDFAAYMLSGQS